MHGCCAAAAALFKPLPLTTCHRRNANVGRMLCDAGTGLKLAELMAALSQTEMPCRLVHRPKDTVGHPRPQHSVSWTVWSLFRPCA